MTARLEKQKKISALLGAQEDPLEKGGARGEIGQGAGKGSRAVSSQPLLQKLSHFYRALIQNLNAGLLVVDRKGQIIFANRKAGQLLGVDARALLQQNFLEYFCSPIEREKISHWMAASSHQIDNLEVRLRHSSGKEMIAGLSASPLEDAVNQFRGLVVLFQDLTHVHRLRHQMERMERLAMLGELSAGIAHEIRNPLAGIKASAQIVLDNLKEDDYRKQLLHRIIREVDKSSKLLNEFFKFARPTKPRASFHNIEMIIDSVYLLLAPRLRKRNIRFVEEYAENLPQVYVDETQIEQVILNLLLNAMDAMPEGGTLTVRTSKREFAHVESGKIQMPLPGEELAYVLVEIQDTGQGIPEHLLDKIFHPFFTTKPEGLGLGLSICSRLVEENRGKIDVVSKRGEGTTFIVALPAFSRVVPKGV